MSQGHYGCTIPAVLTQFKVQQENEWLGEKRNYVSCKGLPGMRKDILPDPEAGSPVGRFAADYLHNKTGISDSHMVVPHLFILLDLLDEIFCSMEDKYNLACDGFRYSASLDGACILLEVFWLDNLVGVKDVREMPDAFHGAWIPP